MAKLNFNAAEALPMEERTFTLIPEGKYLASIIKADVVPTKAEDGERLNLQFKITQGEHKGEMIFEGLNTKNKNPQAVAISDRILKSICDAIGKGNVTDLDTDDLIGTPMEVTVKHSLPSGEYKDENDKTCFKYKPKAEIKAYNKESESEILSSIANADTKVTKDVPWGNKEA